MKRIRRKVSWGLLGASLSALAGYVGCGSDDGAPGACPAPCNGPDASEDSSSGGTNGSAGSAGIGGTAGSGGTNGSAGSGGTNGSAGTGGTNGGPGDSGSDAPADSAPDTGTCSACAAYSPPTRAGNLANASLAELSGIVASRTQPGVFFAHNDSGDSARFFAFDGAGRALGEYRLQGVSATDWEDMALGPCPAGSCLFLGDIGDNGQQRASIAVVRVTEPQVIADAGAGPIVVTHDRFEYRYAPGPQNAEALLADPKSGNLYIVTKNPSGTALVFRIDAPGTPGSVQTLQTLTQLVLPTPGERLVTGGAVHPCGDRLLLRTYDALLEYVTPANQPLEAAFGAVARPVPVASEAQGEAVTYLGDGLGYVTASEGTAPALNVARCQ